MLGVPAAVWSTQKKCWLDGERRPLTQKGDATLVAKCPWRIGIVSTGLIVNGDDEGERGALAKKTFGVVILDEAHKARNSRGQSGREAARPNNLLQFLRTVARNATNVILGTATPIQLEAVELWDMLYALTQGAPQVLGTPFDGGEWIREEFDPVPVPRAALASQRHEPVGPVSQPAAARERARRISRRAGGRRHADQGHCRAAIRQPQPEPPGGLPRQLLDARGEVQPDRAARRAADATDAGGAGPAQADRRRDPPSRRRRPPDVAAQWRRARNDPRVQDGL